MRLIIIMIVQRRPFVDVFDCLFVNAVTLEPFEIPS